MSQFVEELSALGVKAETIEKGKLAVLLALYQMFSYSEKAKTLFQNMTFIAD